MSGRTFEGQEYQVALRKESVDRNTRNIITLSEKIWSLSARRAWIEIQSSLSRSGRPESLSARRAWIEIVKPCPHMGAITGRSPQGERG